MVEHHNTTITDIAFKVLNSKHGDFLSKEVMPVIQPTLDINPHHNRFTTRSFVSSVITTSANGNGLFTSETDRDTYVTSIVLNNQSNATADNTSIFVTVTGEDGTVVTLARLGKLTTTAFDGTIALNLDKPIKMLRGGTISFTNVFTVGASATGITVLGYETPISG